MNPFVPMLEYHSGMPMPNAERCPASKRQGMTGSFSDSLVEGPERVASRLDMDGGKQMETK